MESFEEKLRRLASEKNKKSLEESRANAQAENERKQQVETEARLQREKRTLLVKEQVMPYDRMIRSKLSMIGGHTWGSMSARGTLAHVYFQKPDKVTGIGLSPNDADLLGFWRHGRINWGGKYQHSPINKEENIYKTFYGSGSDVTAEYYQVEYPMQEGEGYFLLRGRNELRAKGPDLDEAFIELFQGGPVNDSNPLHRLIE